MFILFYDNCIAEVFRFIMESHNVALLASIVHTLHCRIAFTLQLIILYTKCRQSGKDEVHTNLQCENNQNILCI